MTFVKDFRIKITYSTLLKAQSYSCLLPTELAFHQQKVHSVNAAAAVTTHARVWKPGNCAVVLCSCASRTGELAQGWAVGGGRGGSAWRGLRRESGSLEGLSGMAGGRYRWKWHHQYPLLPTELCHVRLDLHQSESWHRSKYTH